MTDYKLANIKKKELKLSQQREEILKLEPEEAVDSILSSPQPATLIQSFPSQDLYFLMHSVGPEDFIPVLSLSSSDQWEHILDMDIWADDKPDIPNMTKALGLLFQADSKRLMRWIVKEKVDMLEYYFLKNTEIWIREHDDVPPDEDDFMTFDDKFYFRFPKAYKNEEGKPAQELITNMLDSVAQMDLSVFHALLLETTSVLAPEVEEEQFRLKNVRLAEKGFLPSHEAVGIYQPLSSLKLRERPSRLLDKKRSYNPDIPMASQYTSQFIKGDNLFAASLKLLNNDIFFDLQAEFASLVNKVISADKIKIREKEDIEKVIEKVCAYLSVGIERVDKNNPVPVLEKYFLEDVFRAGSSEILRLGRKINLWHKTSFMNKNNLPLSFLDEKWLGIVGGLMLDRPLFFDVFSQGEAYRNFKSFKEIRDVAIEAEKIIETDKILATFDIDIQSFSKGILTYKSLLFTLWVKSHLGLDNSLSPIPVNEFKDFFAALFSNKKESKIENIKREDFILWVSKVSKIEREEISDDFIFAANEMFDEIEEEYGSVNVNDLDLRLIRHFLLI
ncbi:MAG: hypothetical protein KAJ62_01585 [Desulfobacteraceae bacterium]|nr:hypothetical protein [Desulfobacteraceae bacterium]